MTSKRTRTLALIAVGLTSTVALTACGGSDDAAATDADGVTSIRIGYFPIMHTATVVNADKEGMFEDEDLDVDLTVTAGGAQAIPSLMAGEFDLTYTNYTSVILAAEQGLPLVLVAGNDDGTSDHGIFVTKDSPIASVADLAGKTVAINNLKNITNVAVNLLLEEAGVDISSVKVVEMPFPDMQPALERGDVDAIWQPEPFQAIAQGAGFRKVADPFAGDSAGLPVAGWVATKEFATKHPEAIAGFRAALSSSIEALQDDRELLTEVVPTFTEVPAELMAKVEMPDFNATLEVAALQSEADSMLDFDFIGDEFDVSSIIAE